MNKLEDAEKVLKQLDLYVLKHIKFNEVDYFMASYKFYMEKAHYKEIIIEKENRAKEIIHIKLAMIDDIRYVNTSFYDDDISIIRIFTLTTPTDIQYFTCTGSNNYFGEPKEHTKNDFLRLLENHPCLKDNEVVNHMKSVLLHNELQEDLNTKEIKIKRNKL
jgi:hypothetical protein